jgi:hypothetical protein
VFGVVPALVTTKHPSEILRDGGRHGGGRRLHQVLRTLVVSEVAISLVLLAGAGLLLRSFITLQSVDSGLSAPAASSPHRSICPPRATTRRTPKSRSTRS